MVNLPPSWCDGLRPLNRHIRNDLFQVDDYASALSFLSVCALCATVQEYHALVVKPAFEAVRTELDFAKHSEALPQLCCTILRRRSSRLGS